MLKINHTSALQFLYINISCNGANLKTTMLIHVGSHYNSLYPQGNRITALLRIYPCVPLGYHLHNVTFAYFHFVL